jgi:hypothetical protein
MHVAKDLSFQNVEANMDSSNVIATFKSNNMHNDYLGATIS